MLLSDGCAVPVKFKFQSSVRSKRENERGGLPGEKGEKAHGIEFLGYLNLQFRLQINHSQKQKGLESWQTVRQIHVVRVVLMTVAVEGRECRAVSVLVRILAAASLVVLAVVKVVVRVAVVNA